MQFKVFIRVRETNDYAFQPFELASAFHARLSGIGARDTAALTEHGRSFGSQTGHSLGDNVQLDGRPTNAPASSLFFGDRLMEKLEEVSC